VRARAGAGSGSLMALPDAGDQVLVLLTHDDPGEGVVLRAVRRGGWPDTGIEGGAVRRYTLLTPGGQRIRLDDAGQAIRVENELGSLSSSRRTTAAARGDGPGVGGAGRKVVIRGRRSTLSAGESGRATGYRVRGAGCGQHPHPVPRALHPGRGPHPR
jgi:hypothetical protein